MTPPRSVVYLASQSPRRRELLDQMQVPYQLLPPRDGEDVEALEERLGSETPRTYVRRVTRLKAHAALARLEQSGRPAAPILVGDTTVALGRTILGKPVDADDARRMLRSLAGRAHRVLTAVAIIDRDRLDEALCESRVRFRPLSDGEIDDYVATGEPFGKAGGYAIQGRAARFVTRIAGSHSGIVGLPLYETMQLLHAFGIDPR